MTRSLYRAAFGIFTCRRTLYLGSRKQSRLPAPRPIPVPHGCNARKVFAAPSSVWASAITHVAAYRQEYWSVWFGIRRHRVFHIPPSPILVRSKASILFSGREGHVAQTVCCCAHRRIFPAARCRRPRPTISWFISRRRQLNGVHQSFLCQTRNVFVIGRPKATRAAAAASATAKAGSGSGKMMLSAAAFSVAIHHQTLKSWELIIDVMQSASSSNAVASCTRAYLCSGKASPQRWHSTS